MSALLEIRKMYFRPVLAKQSRIEGIQREIYSLSKIMIKIDYVIDS